MTCLRARRADREPLRQRPRAIATRGFELKPINKTASHIASKPLCPNSQRQKRDEQCTELSLSLVLSWLGLRCFALFCVALLLQALLCIARFCFDLLCALLCFVLRCSVLLVFALFCVVLLCSALQRVALLGFILLLLCCCYAAALC